MEHVDEGRDRFAAAQPAERSSRRASDRSGGSPVRGHRECPIRLVRRRRPWQSLMLNLPTTLFSDIAIHDNDVIVGTMAVASGCSTTLRCCDNSAQVDECAGHLFKPSNAVRVRRNVNYNTPFRRRAAGAESPRSHHLLFPRRSRRLTLRSTCSMRGRRRARMSSAPPRAVRETARPRWKAFGLRSRAACRLTSA